VYHGSDAEPAHRRDVVMWIADRLHVAPTVHHQAREPGDRRGPHRRILSEKSRQTLGVALRYPSYREGLDALLRTP
jgi:hypothetical protein